MQGLDRLGIRAVELVAAIAARLDKTDVTQDAEMFGHRGLIELQDGHDLAHGEFFHDEEGEDFAAARLGYRVEDIGGGGSARHERDITFPYGNMSSDDFRRG